MEEENNKKQPENKKKAAAQHESPILEDRPNNDPLAVKVDLSRRPLLDGKKDALRNLAKSAKERGKHPLRQVALLAAAGLTVGVIAFGLYAYNIATTQIVEGEDQVGFFGQVQRILDEDVEPLKGEDEDRVNILLLGQGGIDHPGGNLTDTVMVASIQPSTGKVALLSLPRDMVIPFNSDPECGVACLEYRKLNYMLELGGVEFAREVMKKVTGLDMHYYVRIDFAGFRQVIDTLGGIDVYVENGFTDSQYPDYNYGYQTITFTEGDNRFDGERALQFARSRHGSNGEASDFARAARQQLILEGVRDKLLSASTLLNPVKISGLLSDLGDRVSTDIELWEMARFAELVRQVDRSAIVNDVIDNSEEGELYSEISAETGAYVLITKAGLGDYSDIQNVAQNAFEVTFADNEELSSEDALVTIQNGSSLNGIANKTSKDLRADGVTVEGVGNAQTKAVAETVVYDLTGGTMPETSEVIDQLLGVMPVVSSLPGGDGGSRIRLGSEIDTSIVNVAALPEGTDFIVLLGADYYALSAEEKETPIESTTNADPAEATLESKAAL